MNLIKKNALLFADPLYIDSEKHHLKAIFLLSNFITHSSMLGYMMNNYKVSSKLYFGFNTNYISGISTL